jgi:phenylalanyl-tRNA synthetase alpha chain
MQDTFYIKDPAMGKLPALAKKVKSSHEGGVAGSTGWGGNWSEEVAKKNLLITHDTYLSAKVLANLKPEDIPKKTFQVMKVFRNEVLDWKHLFEFYQIGGIVVDEDANFRNLLGYLKQFFRKMGYKDVRLRPAHFPYTEPSCEIEVFHPIKKQWVELGGSGIFRPELVKPLLGKDVPVLAWGLGLERILTDYYEINDLREIYANDIKQLKEWKTFMK